MSVSWYYILSKLYRNPNCMVVWMLYGFIGAVYWFLKDESGIKTVALLIAGYEQSFIGW